MIKDGFFDMGAVEYSDFLSKVNGLFSSEEDAFDYLLMSAKCGEKCSVIRLGDGEAKIIGFPDYISLEKAEGQFKIWFGDKKFDDGYIHYFSKKLQLAIFDSEVVGLPTIDRMSVRNEDGKLSNDASNCIALWLSLIDIFGWEMLKQKIIVPANFNHWLQKSKGVRRILDSSKNVGFINHSMSLPESFYNSFLFNSVVFYQIPGETWSRDEKVSKHFPERYTELCRSLRLKNLSGYVFFVGAGVLGKVYCSLIRDRGGVAIDMGAVIDGWNQKIPEQRQGLLRDASKMTIDYLLNKN